MQELIREIVVKHGRVVLDSTQDNDFDLFAAGLDSFGMVDVMMVVEEEFDVVFSGAALNRRSFASINTLTAVVVSLKAASPISGRIAAQ